ncbi:MAG: glycine zipper 2TM domain-containing protein [Rhodocyclaceae bacterium]|nr:MAG: glycine zipper 2TM domain-containing protein [Rhodocyclaceae bacterium]
MSIYKPRLSALAAIGVVALTAAVAGPARADQTLQNVTDYARVIDVAPIAPPQTAREVCRQGPDSYRNPSRSNTGAVLGGLGGALVGSRFGDGNGRVAATVAGAIGGAILGDRYDNNDRDRYEQAPARRCEKVYEPAGPTRYQVSYDYQGQRGTVVMNRDPGDWLRVRRTVTIEQ